MRIVYHPVYLEDYPTASCECPERISRILESVKEYEVTEPERIFEKDLELVHSAAHIQSVKRHNPEAYKVALYSAGGAVKTAEIALNEPAFGLIRPPGHHASTHSAWGFCFFNNMTLSLKMLKEQSLIEKALILDIDLHFGDGTVNILGDELWASILNLRTDDRYEFVEEIERTLNDTEYDIIGVSAGFDTYEKGWGGILTTEDYHIIGNLVKNHCKRRFGLLEGGYYLPDLGKNVKAFLRGLD